METPPFDQIEVRPDGYLWLTNYRVDASSGKKNNGNENEDEAEPQPLLLHSTATLLKQLREPWHDQVTMDSKTIHEDEEMQDHGSDDDSINCDDDQVMEETEVSHQDDGKNNNTKKKTNVKNQYRHLLRESNVADRILTALLHIRCFKHELRKRKRTDRGDFRQSRQKALQHQRDRLQQQKQLQQQNQQQQQEQQAETQDDNVSMDVEVVMEVDDNDNDDGNFQVVGKSQGNKSDNGKNNSDDNDSVCSELELPPHPLVRLVRTLNSMRALAPVLLDMLLHPDRTSTHLRVGRKGTQLKPLKKKPTCWLLGNHVFDLIAINAYHAIQAQLHELLEFLEILDEGTPPPTAFWSQAWPTCVWEPTSTKEPHSILLETPFKVLKDYYEECEESSMDSSSDGSKSNDGKRNSQPIETTIQRRCQACDAKFFSLQFSGRSHAQRRKEEVEQARYQQAIDKLHNRLSHCLERDFPGSHVSVYGSCLSSLSVKASDVDLSLYLPEAARVKRSFQNGFWSPARYEKEMTRMVRDVWRRLMYRKSEFADMVAVTRARVPVVKGCYLKANNPHTVDGSLHFDICFLNDIAVANSRLLREYSLMDESVRELMIIVKKWAKDNKICSAQDNTPSSYAWLNMVVFYLQCLGFVPNLQSPELLEKVGVKRDQNEYWHNVNDLDTCYLTWEQAKAVWRRPGHFDKSPISNTLLLYGFFHFYAIGFPRSTAMISIKRGREDILPKTVFLKCSPFFCIEDPFETFDSHMPHDLGIPVNEPNTRRIFDLLAAAEDHLRNVLLGTDEQEEDLSLWESTETLQTIDQKQKAVGRPNNGKGQRKNNGGSRKKQRGNQTANKGDNVGKSGQNNRGVQNSQNTKQSNPKVGKDKASSSGRGLQPAGQDTKGPRTSKGNSQSSSGNSGPNKATSNSKSNKGSDGGTKNNKSMDKPAGNGTPNKNSKSKGQGGAKGKNKNGGGRRPRGGRNQRGTSGANKQQGTQKAA